MTSRPKLRNSTLSTDIDNEEACLDLLNRLIVLCNLHLPRASSLSDIRSCLFILLFEKICGTSVPDIIQEPKSLEDEAHNVQAIIDTISLDILAISLSHITGEDVVSQNVTAIHNLLEILEGFLLFMHNTSNVGENYGKDHGQTDKSSISRKIGCSKKQPHGISQTTERAVTLNEDSSSENTEEIIALGNSLNSNIFDNSKKESEKLRELHKQSACPAAPVNYVFSETEKDLACKFKKDNECQTEGDKWASSVVDKDKIPSKLSKNKEPCCIIWQHSSVELNYKSPSEELQEGPLESLSDLAQDNLFVPSAHVSHPFVIKDCNLKPEFARVGLRDHQLIAPQDKSGKKIHEESISEKHSSLGETSNGHTSVLPNTVIFKGEKVKKPHPLSKSITNLAAQEEARDQLCREVPLNRRKSKSVEDILMVSPGYTCGLFEPDRNIRGSPEKKEKLELFQRKTSRKLNKQNSQHHAASTSSAFVANDLPALYEKNLENRIRSFLESRDINKHAALQMKKKYKRALKRPVRKVISPLCRKSFLLPYNLNRRSQSSTIPKRLHTRSSLHSAQTSIMNEGQQANNSKEEAVFLQELKEEFPNAYLSPGTVRCMSEKYEQQLFRMSKRIKDALQKKSLTQLQTEEAEKRQKILQNILKKEIYHQQHLKDFNEHKQLQTRVKVSQEEARQQSIHAKHYYDEFHNQMRKKMQKRNFREEVLLKNVFEEGLQLQKQQVIQLRKQAAERQEKDARHHKIYMDALENYYQTQFALLAESLAIEKHDLQERAKAQKRVLQMMRREFRQQMENEVRVVQEQLVADNEDIHFREMDAERYREKLRDKYSAHPLKYKKFENL